MISMNVKVEGLKALHKKLGAMERELPKAVVMGINKTAGKAKTAMKRAISSEFMVTQREVNPNLKLTKANRNHIKATLEPFNSNSKPGARSLNLIHFLEKKVSLAEGRRRKKSEGKRSQLRFKIKRSGPAKIIRGAFVGNKGRTIFKREGKGRLPIKGVYTVGFPKMFGTKRVLTKVMGVVRKELPIEMERALKHVISKRR